MVSTKQRRYARVLQKKGKEKQEIMSNQKFVKVIWRDICGLDSADNSSAWFTKKQAEKEAQRRYEEKFTTVGEIIIDTIDYIVIAATKDDDPEEPLYSDMSMIPKTVIAGIIDLP